MRSFTERTERLIINRFTWRKIFSVGIAFLWPNFKWKY